MQSCSLKFKKKLNLKPDKFFVCKSSHNYGVSPKYGVAQFCLQPVVSQ